MTRAVAILEPGGPEVLRVIERDVRDPGPGEVRLAVRAAAVNPTDIGLRARGEATIPPPWIPGMDAAGIVESVGAGVEHARGRGRGDGRDDTAPRRRRGAVGAARRPRGVGRPDPGRRDDRAGGDAADERAHGAPRSRASRPRRGCDAPRHRRRRAPRLLRDSDREAARTPGARRRRSGGRGARARLRRRRRRAARRRMRRGGARGGSRRRRRRLRHRADGSRRVSGDPHGRGSGRTSGAGTATTSKAASPSARSRSQECWSGRTGCAS